MKVVIAAGGTGGHIMPGLALAEHFTQHGDSVFIITREKDRTLIKQMNQYRRRSFYIDVGYFSRSRFFSNITAILKFIRAAAQCRRWFKTVSPDIIIGMGGFVSVAPLFAALNMHIPILLCEQNSVPGKANRLVAGWADAVAVTYQTSYRYFKSAVLTGNPVRHDIGIIRKKEAREQYSIKKNKPVLLVMCGSQGAQQINEWLLSALPDLRKFTIIWSCGKAHYRSLNKAIHKQISTDIKLYSFIENTAAAYAAADIILCRAGATTLSEITAAHLPAVIIPYPYAADNHQQKNAEELVRKNAAVMALENALNPQKLVAIIQKAYTKRNALKKALGMITIPDSVERIYTLTKSIVKRKKYVSKN